MARTPSPPAGGTTDSAPGGRAVDAERNRVARKEHAARTLGEMDGLTITGLRLSDPKSGERGLVVTLDAGEAGQVISVVRRILDARARAS